MKVAMVGSGKLGFPVGCVMAGSGHSVMFHDVDQALLLRYKEGILPEHECGLPALWEKVVERLQYTTSYDDVARFADIVFVAVQTPHAPEQDGSTRFHHFRENFGLQYVKDALSGLRDACLHAGRAPLIVIISTMLPGSMDEEIAPIWPSGRIAYSPQFIAMGTVVFDYGHPEFWLVGVGSATSGEDADLLSRFYRTINGNVPICRMSWASAELCKVAYNTTITMKITLANLVAHVADSIPGCNAFDVTDALRIATHRLASGSYMRPGMVDGGGCHPRDNIALSWLAEKLCMPYNLYDYMMTVRERQTEWLARKVAELSRQHGLPVLIVGTEFKAGIPWTNGSPGLLLAEILRDDWGIEPILYSRWRPEESVPPSTPLVAVITADDPEYHTMAYPPGSYIVDPWGAFVPREGCTVVTPGVCA